MINSFRGDYFFLSNFYESPLLFEGKFYLNSEAAFQAQKTIDKGIRDKFSKLSAKEAKSLGRNVQLRRDWEDIKDLVMYNILKEKFNNEFLGRALVATEPFDLIEGNTWGDTYWGMCNGKGRNQLGITLMQIRKELNNG